MKVKKTTKRAWQYWRWFEDLPARDAPLDRDAQALEGDINAMDEVYLDVSRASTLKRGVGIATGIFCLVFVLFMHDALAHMIWPLEQTLVASIIVWAIAIYLICLLVRVDLFIPRDRPIRFNRIRNKVYIYEYEYSANPFARWPTTIKVFDWDTLHAEIRRQAGYNGKSHIEQFALWLVSVKPESDEVVDWVELKGNVFSTEALYKLWAYCRQYMLYGPDALPLYRPRQQAIRLRHSLFAYMRFLEPTQEGRELRQSMHWSERIIRFVLIILTFWLVIPLGLCHYIALRLAPEVNWPATIDIESKSR